MKDKLQDIAQSVRHDVIMSLAPKVSIHIGCAMGIVDILVYLYFEYLHIDPKKPNDSDRDIFILSKGHAGIAQFATLAERGYFDKKIVNTYDRDGGVIPGHSSRVLPGIEASTGSLGHGLPIGVGYAVAAKGDNIKKKVVVMLSDGELEEGSNWEAIMFAAQHQLDNVIVIVDVNGFQGYAPTKDVINLNPMEEKFKVFGWDTYKVNGHDSNDMRKIFMEVDKRNNQKPVCVLAKTVKGKGMQEYEGKFESHYDSLNQATIDRIAKTLEAK